MQGLLICFNWIYVTPHIIKLYLFSNNDNAGFNWIYVTPHIIKLCLFSNNDNAGTVQIYVTPHIIKLYLFSNNDNAGTVQMTTLVGQLTDAKENSVTSICDAFIRSRSM